MQKAVEWQWGEVHEEAFNEIKCLLCRAPVLASFDPLKELCIQCDSSQLGLGAVLLQDGRPKSKSGQRRDQVGSNMKCMRPKIANSTLSAGEPWFSQITNRFKLSRSIYPQETTKLFH